jgi:hypothetical protein
MMLKTVTAIAIATCALSFGTAPRVNAGTEMLTDNSAPAPRYNYTPPPPPRPRVYVVPPPPVVVYPAFGYYRAPVRFYGYSRYHGYRWGHGYRRGYHHR